MLVAGAIIAVVCLASLVFLHSRAPDFWSYGKLGLSDGTAGSTVFFVEVCGVGRLPTMAYIVRCPDQSTAPINMLDVSHSVVAQINSRTRVVDHWRSDCMLLVGRRVGEQIAIPLDTATAQEWFDRPGAAIGSHANCQKFWDEVVSPRIAEFDSGKRAIR